MINIITSYPKSGNTLLRFILFNILFNIDNKKFSSKDIEKLGVHIYHDMNKGLEDVDVVVMLRLQRERMRGALLPSEDEYFKRFGLTNERMKNTKKDAIVMHPGPINRGVEIDSDVADGKHSVILQQVSHGIAIRMAIMAMVMGQININQNKEKKK